MRWLSRPPKAQRKTISLNEVPVSNLLREKDPSLHDVGDACWGN
jgi:hypothetical protein